MKFHNQLIIMLTDCHFSFRFVKRSIFRALINSLRSNIRVFERIKIKFLCDAFILKIENSLLNDFSLNTRFSLTLDVWINKQQHFFLKINVYYITDSWQFKKKLLKFKSLVDKHTSWQMTNVMLKLLIKNSINDRLLTITIAFSIRGSISNRWYRGPAGQIGAPLEVYTEK